MTAVRLSDPLAPFLISLFPPLFSSPLPADLSPLFERLGCKRPEIQMGANTLVSQK